ncbi:hypothetical protein EJ04DRAFT_442034 [Polyplosphaeria fusca]|uniref:AA1-like domain-containing protein n=1 Tax=Polyplosphaeria fusca TaxID=682080 RepID=A0A9P4V0B9_9PLEO|nr:hypothetical protein EJ04DRAFT_442034 [Polyplosphaeria fusca]
MHPTPFLALGFAYATTSVASHMAATQWTIRGMTRTIDSKDTLCTYDFAIDTNGDGVSKCVYSVVGSPASQTEVSPDFALGCGPFTVSSKWNGVFGDGNGFTTWQVVDYAKKIETFPSYEDWALKNGTAVEPDRSFVVQPLV